MWLFAYFQELSNKDPTSFKTFRLHAMHSLLTLPYDDLMSFFLGLANRALLHLFLKLDYVHISAWKQNLASPQPYSHDFESSLTLTSTTCRVLISGGCFAFSTSLFASSNSLQPYPPRLYARKICLLSIYPNLTSFALYLANFGFCTETG